MKDRKVLPGMVPAFAIAWCGSLSLTAVQTFNGSVSADSSHDQEGLRRIHELVGAALKHLSEPRDEAAQATHECTRAVRVH